MDIQLANQTHIPALIHLLKQVGQVHHDIRPDIFPAGTQKYDENQLLEVLADKDRPIFVALNDNAVTGYCFCKIKRHEENACSVPRTEVYIDDLCVDENHRRMGLAKALYNHTLAYAKETGCNMVTLHVWNGNDGAIRFYEQMGMRPRYIMMEIPVEE